MNGGRRRCLVLSLLIGAYVPSWGQSLEWTSGFNNAVQLCATGRYAEAMPILEKLIGENPDHPQAHYKYGVALFNTDQFIKAEQEFRTATLKKPDYADAFFNLGQTLIKLKRCGEAQPVFANAAALNQADEDIWLRWAYSLECTRDWVGAADVYTKAMAAVPYNQRPVLLLGRATAYLSAGNSARSSEDSRGVIRQLGWSSELSLGATVVEGLALLAGSGADAANTFFLQGLSHFANQDARTLRRLTVSDYKGQDLDVRRETADAIALGWKALLDGERVEAEKLLSASRPCAEDGTPLRHLADSGLLKLGLDPVALRSCASGQVAGPPLAGTRAPERPNAVAPPLGATPQPVLPETVPREVSRDTVAKQIVPSLSNPPEPGRRLLCFELVSAQARGTQPFILRPFDSNRANKSGCSTIDEAHPFVAGERLTLAIHASPGVGSPSTIRMLTVSPSTSVSGAPVRNLTSLTTAALAPARESCEGSGLPETSYLPLTNRLMGGTALDLRVSAIVSSPPLRTQDANPADGEPETGAKAPPEPCTEEVVELLDLSLIVHPRYYFDLSLGVAVSALRTPGFSRVALPTQPDGSAPQYATRVTEGAPLVSPLLLVTAYLRPKDLERRSSISDLIPEPCFGLSLASPTGSFFVGATIAVSRMVRLAVGANLANLAVPADMDPSSGAAPATRKNFHARGFIGITIPLSIIALFR